MALYSEPSSMIRTSSVMCAERSPAPADMRLAGPARIDPPGPSDALKAGTCRRCGCVARPAHAAPGDCIDALREALAELTSGEVRRIGRPPKRERIGVATEVATA